jgi:hypothetical protein
MFVLVDSALDVQRFEVVLQLLNQNVLGWRIHAHSENDLVLSDSKYLSLLDLRDRFFAHELGTEGW